MALVIGLIAGAVCFYACTELKQRLDYDDSLDVFGVHGVGGIPGTLLCRRVRHRRVSMSADTPAGLPGLLEGNPGQLLTPGSTASSSRWRGAGLRPSAC